MLHLRSSSIVALLFVPMLPLLACGSEVTEVQYGAGGGSSTSGTSGTSGSATSASATSGTGGAGGESGAPPTYSAHNLFTHVPRFTIFKADPARDLCFRLYIEGLSGTGAIGIDTTSPWAVARAEVTPHASDCTLDNGYPKQSPNAVDAVKGSGTLTITGDFPCEVTIHAVLGFDATQGAWIPMSESLDADALPVDGGCG